MFNPLQCYKCQRIGHIASSCKAKQCCLRCGEGHSRDDCVAETLRCAGCKGEHQANSRECPLVQHAHEVERLRSRGLSYREAVIKLKEPCAAVDSGKTYSQGSRSIDAEVSLILPKGYSGALKKSDNALSSLPKVQTVGTQTTSFDASSQTDQTGDSLLNHCNEGTDTPELPDPVSMLSNPTPHVDFIQGLLTNFVKYLTELFSLNLSTESPANREKLIHSCFRNNLPPLKNLPTATAAENNTRVEMPVDDDPVVYGVRCH